MTDHTTSGPPQGRLLYEKMSEFLSRFAKQQSSGDPFGLRLNVREVVHGFTSEISDHAEAVDKFYREAYEKKAYDIEEQIRLVRAASERTLAEYLARLTELEQKFAGITDQDIDRIKQERQHG